MTDHVPKAVLYFFPRSIWSATVLLALEEKGYGDDEVDRKVVDLWNGGQFEPTFLRLNPKATVPTLVVPLEKTLSRHIESRYKALTETKAIVDFLDKSRSVRSRTHTTSRAPAPSLAPATFAAMAISERIIEMIHTVEGDPNTWTALNAWDHDSLKMLEKCLSDAEEETIHVSEKVKTFWRDKKAAIDEQLGVLLQAEKGEGELDEEGKGKRQAFFAKAIDAWQVSLADILLKVNAEIAAPFTLGDQLCVADLHLGAWMTRLVALVGGTSSDDGRTVVKKIEEHFGGMLVLPKNHQVGGRKESKLAMFWDAIKDRASWKKIYKTGLF